VGEIIASKKHETPSIFGSRVFLVLRYFLNRPGDCGFPLFNKGLAIRQKTPRFADRGVFCLPSEAGKPGLLEETGVAPTRGKTIRIARALLVTAGSEGSDRK
jgi:hypothetical protein